MKRLLTLLFVLCLLLWCGAVSALAEGVLRLPASVKDVGEEAFCGDASLDEVVLPEGVETIGARAFAESSLRTVNLPSSLTSIDGSAFDGPEKVTVTAVEGS